MYKALIFLLLTTPLCAVSDFEEYREHDTFVEAFEESIPQIKDEIMVMLQDEMMEMDNDVVFTSEKMKGFGVPEELYSIFQEKVARGSTVIDFGETSNTSKLLASIVGPFGKVLSFDTDRTLCTLHSANIEAHPVNLENILVDLDTFELDHLSLIKVDAWGNEDLVIEGATRLIAKDRPFLLINMLGGIPVEKTDRYVKEEFDARMEQIKHLGYVIQRVTDTFYLAMSEEDQ